jgi:hypothetical protein
LMIDYMIDYNDYLLYDDYMICDIWLDHTRPKSNRN